MTLPRLGVRLRLLAAVVGAVVLALAIAIAAFNFLLGQRLSASATSLAKAEAEAGRSSLVIRNGRLIVPGTRRAGTLDGRVWVFAGSRVLAAPSASPTIERTARSLASGPERARNLREVARLYVLPVVQHGTRYGTVVSAISLDPYEETGRTALVGSLILAVILLGAVTLVSHWMLERALLPVSRMTDDAETWSEHDLDRRFDLGEPYDELTRLAATLDGLLERLAASLRHEQRFTAELSHELRTPLARISGQAELMLKRDRPADEYRAALEAIQRSVEQMTRTVETLVAAGRQEAGLTRATSDARAAVRAAVVGARGPVTRVDVQLSVPAEAVMVAVDEELVERTVQPLVDNAVRYARTAVSVSLVRDGHAAWVHVLDDGPGVSQAEQAEIFYPGRRGTAAAGRNDGTGLGLSLARRLALSAGGEISVTPSSAGGRFALRLPLAR
jgi:signal transduction histidine kinase